MGKTYREVLSRASSFLESRGKEGHSILYVFLGRKQWNKTDWVLKMNQPISKEDEAMMEEDLKRLLENYPPQYLLGHEEFYGHRFKVTDATLIPRPETEELVELCLKTLPENTSLKIVDIGTGTGAIAVSLKLARPQWLVTAIDLSEAALAVAQENADNLGAEVRFLDGDTLAPVPSEQFDIIISNPPYISESEWNLMDESVRLFEPKQALFAEAEGLAIYKKIAQQAKTSLKPEGHIFLEIGFRQGEAVKEIFQRAFPKKRVRVLPDLSGNDRIIHVYGKG